MKELLNQIYEQPELFIVVFISLCLILWLVNRSWTQEELETLENAEAFNQDLDGWSKGISSVAFSNIIDSPENSSSSKDDSKQSWIFSFEESININNYELETYLDKRGENRYRIIAGNNKLTDSSHEGYKNYQDMKNQMIRNAVFILSTFSNKKS